MGYTINTEKIVWKKTGQESVVLNIETGEYYTLDEISTTVLDLLSQGKDNASIINFLNSEYDVQRNSLEKDISALISDLKRYAIIS